MSTTHFSEFKNIKFDGGVGGNGGRVGVVTLATDQTIGKLIKVSFLCMTETI